MFVYLTQVFESSVTSIVIACNPGKIMILLITRVQYNSYFIQSSTHRTSFLKNGCRNNVRTRQYTSQ